MNQVGNGETMPQAVLIVDDTPSIHQLIKVHLSEEPWTLHSANDGTSGLAMVASLMPDLVLLDVDLPDMNGFDVCKQLRDNPQTTGIAVIFLTASASNDA